MNKRDYVIACTLKDTIEEMQGYMNEANCTDYEAFLNNSILKRATTMCLISISELALNFSDIFKVENAHINLSQFKMMRNIAAHKYGSLNFAMVWKTIMNDIPVLKNQIDALIDSYE